MKDTEAPLLSFSRGGHTEIVHRGSIVVIDGDGKVHLSLGNAKKYVHLRSLAKPLQLLSFLQDDLHKKSWKGEQITLDDLAVMLASHSGEAIHTAQVKRLMHLADLTEDNFLCGTHPPFSMHARCELFCAKQKPSVLHNNCSGKHVAMLMQCVHHRWPLNNYVSADHPLQQKIFHNLSVQAKLAPSEIETGVDGCSVPTYIIPFHRLAFLYAQIAKKSEFELIRRAANARPDLVAGDKRLDTLLMQALPNQLLAKTGADGGYAIAVYPCERYPTGLGIAIKLEDGDPNHKARTYLAIEALCRFGLLQKGNLPPQLKELVPSMIFNHRKVQIGDVTVL